MRQMILLWTIAGVISKITKTSLNLLVISSFKNNELEQDWGYIGRVNPKVWFKFSLYDR